MLAAEAVAVFEGRGELRRGVKPPFGRLLKEKIENDLCLAVPLGIVTRSDFLAGQPLATRIDLGPGTADLVDQLRRQRRSVPEFDLEAGAC